MFDVSRDNAPLSGAVVMLNGLNPNDPKVAAALKACQSKAPHVPQAIGQPQRRLALPGSQAPVVLSYGRGL